MKRIPQKTAVQTISYSVSPQSKVVIIDRENMYDKGKEVFNGIWNDLSYDLKYTKILLSEVHGIDVKDDTLIITIETRYEEY